MNITDKLLTEVESSNLAGVGIDTLNKYSEIGLLDAILKENQKFYYENDVKTLFYAQLKAKTIQDQTTQTPLEEKSTTTASATENLIKDDSILQEQPTLITKESVIENTVQENISTNAETTKTNSPAIASDNFFPSNIELLEINKSLREQIQIFREERNWLRERIEKLETRSEREQMLLLSESENLRSMIKASKRTFWEKALPWFGNKS